MKTVFRLSIVSLAVVFAAASASDKKKAPTPTGPGIRAIKVLPKPDTSEIYLDDTQIGSGVTTVELSEPRRTYRLKVCGPEGYFCKIMEIDYRTQDNLEINAPKDHSYFETVAGRVAGTDVVNKWIQIQVAKKYEAAKAWQKLTSILAGGVSDFEVLDQKSFYMKSAWKVAGRPSDQLRTRSRFVVSADSVEKGNIVFKLKIESERINPAKERVEYTDRTYREFLESLEAAQNRLKL